jgi:hypothetical protein
MKQPLERMRLVLVKKYSSAEKGAKWSNPLKNQLPTGGIQIRYSWLYR